MVIWQLGSHSILLKAKNRKPLNWQEDTLPHCCSHTCSQHRHQYFELPLCLPLWWFLHPGAIPYISFRIDKYDFFFFFWSVKGDTGDHERRGRKGDSAGCLFLRQMDFRNSEDIWKWRIWKLIPLRLSVPMYALENLHVSSGVCVHIFCCCCWPRCAFVGS